MRKSGTAVVEHYVSAGCDPLAVGLTVVFGVARVIDVTAAHDAAVDGAAPVIDTMIVVVVGVFCGIGIVVLVGRNRRW